MESLVGLIGGNPDDFENFGFPSDEDRGGFYSSSLEDDEPVQEEDVKKVRMTVMELERSS